MAIARLHLICGNCGCNDLWELYLERDGDDISDEEVAFEDSCRLVCKNCCTHHDLKDSVNRTIFVKKGLL